MFNIFVFLVQSLCGVIKQAIINLLDDGKPILPDLCNLIIAILQFRCVAPAVENAKTVKMLLVHSLDIFNIGLIYCSASLYFIKTNSVQT